MADFEANGKNKKVTRLLSKVRKPEGVSLLGKKKGKNTVVIYYSLDE